MTGKPYLGGSNNCSIMAEIKKCMRFTLFLLNDLIKHPICCIVRFVHVFSAERYPTDTPTAYLVYAGREPQRFKNLFPYWQDDDAVIALANSVSV